MVYHMRPVRDDGAVGRWVASQPTEVVVAAAPALTSLTIEGDVVEGGVVTAVASYIGGLEGESEVTWYRCDARNWAEAVPVGSGRSYTVQFGDVGSCLRVDYVPVRADGVPGARATVTTQPAAPSVPQARSLRLEAGPIEWGTPIK